ncbi:ABC transporter type 1, transmembrane domain-containing protein [Cladochytrium replicatum]|nr:ABC transporter type 1, transmembrane domain-containing protein [Cladochytrium replicatum]
MARTSKVALLFLVPTGSALILGLSLKTNSAYCEAGGKSDQVGSGLPPNLVIAEEQNLDHAEQELKAALKPRDIPSRTIISLIWKHLRPDWLLLFAIIAVTSASAFVNVMTPMVVGELVSLIQSMLKNPLFGTIDFDIKVLNRPATKLLILFMSQGFLTFVDITLVTRLGENLAQRLRHDLAGSILKQDIAFFDAHMQGEVVGRLTQDVSEFKHTFKLCVTQGLKCTAQIVGSAYHLFRISPSLTLTLLSTMPVVYVGMNLYGAFLRQLSKDARLFDGFAAGVVSEAVSNIRTVRAFASEDRELERYEEATREASVKSLALGFHIGAFQGITNSTVGLMILIILYSGGNLVVKGELTGGQLMSYMVATQTAQRSLGEYHYNSTPNSSTSLVGALVGQVVKALSSAQRVVEYMNVRPTIHLNDGIIPAKFDGTIEFVDIGFTYPTRPNAPVLQNFSLIIPRGKVVALCGMSGSGKSTVGQLIERFYDPDFGKVLIDGIDVRQLNGNWLHDNIGYINQEPILFATSILENIRYGRPDASMDEVIRAAKEANAASFIESFPNKYDTVVGERGRFFPLQS